MPQAYFSVQPTKNPLVPVTRMIFDFDHYSTWCPIFSSRISGITPLILQSELQEKNLEYSEDALRIVLEAIEPDILISETAEWLRSVQVAAYHGTRLNEIEADSIRCIGIRPLIPSSRRTRLLRALSIHPGWSSISSKVEAAIEAFGEGERAGRREGQTHLTLSRVALTQDFSHYLKYGSEFDFHVAHHLLGQDGLDLLEKDGNPMILKIAVPGSVALRASNIHFSVEEMMHRGQIPNLIREVLEAWSYQLAYPDFASSHKVDCGLRIDGVVPPDWILECQRF